MARPTTQNRAFVAAYIGSSARCYVDATRNPPQVKELKAEVLIRNPNKKVNSWSKTHLMAWLESNPREEGDLHPHTAQPPPQRVRFIAFPPPWPSNPLLLLACESSPSERDHCPPDAASLLRFGFSATSRDVTRK